MGLNTLIEWAHHTWNPWQGCHKVSPGCLHCYMETAKRRYGQDPDVVVRSAFKTFYAPSSWDTGRVFVCSWSDFFIEEADPWRRDAWEVMALNPQLTFLILTKRPENIAARLPDHWPWPFPNVWVGVTAENQEMADKRIPILMETEATRRFISVEPMLGPVDLTSYLNRPPGYTTPMSRRLGDNGVLPDIDWVICGCESGPGHRDMDLDWVRALKDQCVNAEVSFFLKQAVNGSGRIVKMPGLDLEMWDEVPGEG